MYQIDVEFYTNDILQQKIKAGLTNSIQRQQTNISGPIMKSIDRQEAQASDNRGKQRRSTLEGEIL